MYFVVSWGNVKFNGDKEALWYCRNRREAFCFYLRVNECADECVKVIKYISRFL